MAVVILAGLWLAGAPTAAGSDAQEIGALFEKLGDADEQLADGNVDAAWKIADDILRRYAPPRRGGKGQLHRALCQALVLRGECYRTRGEAQKALADLDAAVEVNPDQPWALWERSRALEMLGRHAEAEADRRQYAAMFEEIMADSYRPRSAAARAWFFGWCLQYTYATEDRKSEDVEHDDPEETGDQHEDLDDEVGQPVTATLTLGPFRWTWDMQNVAGRGAAYTAVGSLYVVLAWLLMFGGNCLVGVGARRQGRGTWRRLAGVSAGIGALQVAPWTAGVLLMALAPPSVDLMHLAVYALTMLILGWLLLVPWLRPPTRLPGGGPLLQDAELLDRIDAMARQLGVRAPVARVTRTLGPDLMMQAGAGGLVAPTVIIYDGVLHRLPPDERDAVLAHELAHFANYSLWIYAAVMALGCAAAVLAAGISSAVPAPLVGLLVFLGLLVIVSRFCELDCDRRAAGVVGPVAMASMLLKLHADEWRRLPAFTEVLFGSLFTHPLCDRRVSAVQRLGSGCGEPTVAWSARKVRWQRLISWSMFAVWLFTLVVIAECQNSVVLVTAAKGLWCLMLLGIVAAVVGAGRVKWRRTTRWDDGSGMRAPSWLVLLGAVIVNAAFLLSPILRVLDVADTIGLGMDVAGSVLLLVGWAGRRASGICRLERAIQTAVHEHDFHQIVELARAKPRLVARYPHLRHNVALSRALAGDPATGIEELERLLADVPRHKFAWRTLAELHLDQGNGERALELANEAISRRRKGPHPHLVASQALLQLGRVDEADEAIGKALALVPRDGLALAIAAQVALARGDHEAALAGTAAAEEWLPGQAYIRLVEAELAIRTEDPATALSAVLEAIAAATHNPFALIRGRAGKLLYQLP